MPTIKKASEDLNIEQWATMLGGERTRAWDWLTKVNPLAYFMAILFYRSE